MKRTDKLMLYTLKCWNIFVWNKIQEVDYDFDGVPVRVYEPVSRNAAAPQPGIVYYHGGGWMYGNIGL
jgi:acetyl esterase/lipase